MKTMRPVSRFLQRVGRFFGIVLQPRHFLPSVGLVVLGGCLTFIITPDDEGDAPAPKPRRNEFPLVILDPGHGGRDEGTRWRGVTERDLTLDLALRVERLLKIAGYRTMLTRREDVYVPLEERSRVANQQGDAVFVSLHFNSESSTGSNGIETYYAKEKQAPANDWSWVGIFNRGEQPPDTSEALAAAIQDSLILRTEAKNRGIHQSNFYVVHHTRCPAVLVEGGFISNAFESSLLSSESYRELLAQGIAEGLLRYQQTIPPERPAAPAAVLHP